MKRPTKKIISAVLLTFFTILTFSAKAQISPESFKNPPLEFHPKNEPMPAGARTTFSTTSFYKNGDPLLSSGLLGPVKIVPSANFYYKP